MSFKNMKKMSILKYLKTMMSLTPLRVLKMLLKNTTNLERQRNIIYTMVLLRKMPKGRSICKKTLRMFAAHW